MLTGDASTGGVAQLRRALRRRVDQAIRNTPFAQRSARARALDVAVRRCLNAGGAGIESLLATALRSSATDNALADEVLQIAARLPSAHDRHASAAPHATLVALYAFGPEPADGNADGRSDISLAV